MRRLLPFALSLTLVAVASLCSAEVPAAGAAGGCSRPRPTINLSRELRRPVLDNTLPRPALQGILPGGEGTTTEGLYTGRLTGAVTRKTGIQGTAGDVCVRVDRIDVQITIAPRTIYIARGRRPGSCGYNVVLEHERKHEAVDDDVVIAHLPIIRQALETAATMAGTLVVPAYQRQEAVDRLTKAISDAFDRAITQLTAEQARRQAAVDTPQEYARVSAACGARRRSP